MMLCHLFVSAGIVEKNAFDFDIPEFDHGFWQGLFMFFWGFFPVWIFFFNFTCFLWELFPKVWP